MRITATVLYQVEGAFMPSIVGDFDTLQNWQEIPEQEKKPAAHSILKARLEAVLESVVALDAKLLKVEIILEKW